MPKGPKRPPPDRVGGDLLTPSSLAGSDETDRVEVVGSWHAGAKDQDGSRPKRGTSPPEPSSSSIGGDLKRQSQNSNDIHYLYDREQRRQRRLSSSANSHDQYEVENHGSSSGGHQRRRHYPGPPDRSRSQQSHVSDTGSNGLRPDRRSNQHHHHHHGHRYHDMSDQPFPTVADDEENLMPLIPGNGPEEAPQSSPRGSTKSEDSYNLKSSHKYETVKCLDTAPIQQPPAAGQTLLLVTDQTIRQAEGPDRPVMRSRKLWDAYQKMTPYSKVAVAAILLLVLVCILVVLAVLIELYIGYLEAAAERRARDEEEKRINEPKEDCQWDGFMSLTYSFNNVYGEEVDRYVKYRFVDDVIGDKFYNFPTARNECAKLNSTLWEVLDGESEWDAVIEVAKELNRADVWINAQVIGFCPGLDPNGLRHLSRPKNDSFESTESPRIDGGDPSIWKLTRCKVAEAGRGMGLEIQWPSMEYNRPHYSRLIKGADPDNPQAKCARVDNFNKHVWDVVDCEKMEFWGLCIKRRCKLPPPTGSN